VPDKQTLLAQARAPSCVPDKQALLAQASAPGASMRVDVQR